jgi:hypothetical protein
MFANGMMGGALVALFALSCIKAWRGMSGIEKVAAVIVGLAMAAVVILNNPDKYLNPHIVKTDVRGMTTGEYATALAPLVAVFAASAVLMWIKFTRALATGFWIGMSLLLAFNWTITLWHGGPVYQ